MPGGIPEGRDSVMVGTSLRLFPAVHTYSVSVSYTWWFVFILSSAAAHGGAISANSQRWVLHQPRTCYSFSLPIYSPSMPARCVGMSLCVMFLPCMCGDLLSSLFLYCVQDPQARTN